MYIYIYIYIAYEISRKFYIRRKNNKNDSNETGCHSSQRMMSLLSRYYTMRGGTTMNYTSCAFIFFIFGHHVET